MGYIGYIPSFWMSETWSFAGPDIHLQFAGAESSAEAWHFDWSSPDRLSSRRVHGWIERFIGILNLKQCEHFPGRMCQWQLSNPSLDHVWCPNTAVLSRSGQYKPCEWWLAKKIQNSQSKRMVSVFLVEEGAIFGLWQVSLSQHVWLFKFFRGSSEAQKQRMLIPNLDIAT